MILSGRTIRKLGIITPHCERTVLNGMSYGESLAGYDIRVKEKSLLLNLSEIEAPFKLVSSIEYFKLPNNVLGFIHDKSSLAREGLSVQNTVLEPGWEGYLTLELNFNKPGHLAIEAGSPIAQVVFHYVDEDTEGYKGKYQNQPNIPVEAIYEQTKTTR